MFINEGKDPVIFLEKRRKKKILDNPTSDGKLKKA